MENQKCLILGKVDQQKGNNEKGQKDIGKSYYSVFYGHFSHVIGKPNWNISNSSKGQKYQSPHTIE
jgi:hypothetical protein